MTQETKNIVDPNDRGYQSISIPDLSPEDISSLGDVAVDQDLREKANSVRRRGSLFGLAALCFVGALGLVSRSRSNNIVVASDVSLLHTGVEVEETGTEVAVLSSDAEYTTAVEYTMGVEQVPPIDPQYCSGKLKIPPEFDLPNDPDKFKKGDPIFSAASAGKNPTPPACRAENARAAFSEALGTIAGHAIGDSGIQSKYLQSIIPKATWAVIAGSGMGAVYLGLGLTLAGFLYDLACTNPHGLTPSELQIKDVANIARDVVEDKIFSLARNDFQSALMEIQTRKNDGFDPDELRDLAQQFYDVALDAAEGGYEATLMASNSAKISLMLLNWLREESHVKGYKDCCRQAAARIDIYRKNYVAMGKRLRKSLDDYKNARMDSSKWAMEWKNRWVCANVVFGGYYNQYKATAFGPSGGRIADAWSQDGFSGRCPGNDDKQNEARNKLRPKVQNHVNEIESKTWTEDIKFFYDEMAVDIQDYDCEAPKPAPGRRALALAPPSIQD